MALARRLRQMTSKLPWASDCATAELEGLGFPIRRKRSDRKREGGSASRAQALSEPCSTGSELLSRSSSRRFERLLGCKRQSCGKRAAKLRPEEPRAACCSVAVVPVSEKRSGDKFRRRDVASTTPPASRSVPVHHDAGLRARVSHYLHGSCRRPVSSCSSYVRAPASPPRFI